MNNACRYSISVLDLADDRACFNLAQFVRKEFGGVADTLVADRLWPSKRCWVIATDRVGEIVGFHRLVIVGQLAFLRMLFVCNKARNQGVATTLIEKVIGTATEYGARRVIAWAWDRNNEREMLASKFGLLPLRERFWRYKITQINNLRDETSFEIQSVDNSNCNAEISKFVRDIAEIGSARNIVGAATCADSGLIVIRDQKRKLAGGCCFVNDGKKGTFFGVRLSVGYSRREIFAALAAWSVARNMSELDIALPTYDLEGLLTVFSLRGKCLLEESTGVSARDL